LSAEMPAAIPNVDIDRAAWIMIRNYGGNAMLEAAIRADNLLDAGNFEACSIWRRILDAIERLQAKAPAEGEKVH